MPHRRELQFSLALVGRGSWGRCWQQTMQDAPSVDLRWICEVAEARPSALLESIKWTRSLKTMLSDPQVQGVVLATPPSTHAALGAQILRAGKHVLIEKPLATTAEAAEELCAIASLQGQVLMVNHLLVFHEAFKELNRQVSQGRVGRILGVAGVRHSVAGSPALALRCPAWTLGPHDLSLTQRLVPGLLSKLALISSRSGRVVLGHKGEPVSACFSFSVDALKKERRFAVVGERATLVFDDLAASKLILYPGSRTADELVALWRTGGHLKGAVPLRYCATELSRAPLELALESFLTAIRTGVVDTSGAEGTLVVGTLARLFPSMDSARTRELLQAKATSSVTQASVAGSQLKPASTSVWSPTSGY